MKIKLVFDKTHNLLIKLLKKNEKVQYSFPTAGEVTEILKPFPNRHIFAENKKLIANSHETTVDVFLLKKIEKPPIEGYSWIPLITLKGQSVQAKIKNEIIVINGEELLTIYYSVILQGYSSLAGKYFDVWHFCNNEPDANKLVELVKAGTKRATASLLDVYEIEEEKVPEIGDYSVVTNFDGFPEVIIRTTQVDIVPYKEVSAEFAFIEGEGDKSLDYWKKVHLEFFTEDADLTGLEFTEDSLIICEHFEVDRIIKK